MGYTVRFASSMSNIKIVLNAMVMTAEERKKKKAEYHKRYYHEHRDEILSKMRERRKAAYMADPARFAEYTKKYEMKNLEKTKAYRRSYYLKNREKILAIAKKWRKEHPERVKANNKKNYDAERQRRAYARKIERERNGEMPDIDKVAALFKSETQAGHLRWLVNKKREEIRDMMAQGEKECASNEQAGME